MRVVQTAQELQSARATIQKKVGFVPTMGNLHQGHISLLEEAVLDTDVVFFSIFVNPKQFGPSEDFQKYPRTLDDDLRRIERALHGKHGKEVLVFAPISASEIYPEGADQRVNVLNLGQILEGEKRPGHFEGVATVVLRLFGLVKPDVSYFGLKDYQQYLVIRQMVKDLCLPIEIRGMPIIREDNGLALSSRNQYLSPEQRKHATLISQTLFELKRILNGSRANIEKAQAFIQKSLEDKNWNYLELRDAMTLGDDLQRSTAVTILAVYQLGATRLLDNVQVELG